MNKNRYIFLFLISGCVSSRLSINDNSIFSEQPRIVTKDGRYFLRFRYADSPKFVFYMLPESKVKNHKLIFYLPCTTSSGNLHGVVQYEEIITSNKVDLIKEGLVFWEEPDKTLIPIKIAPLEESISSLHAH